MKYSEQTEKEILNSAIIKQESLNRLMEFDRELFYYNEHRIIFDILKDIYESGTQVDLSIIGLKLKEKNIFDEYEKHLLSIIKSYTPITIDEHLETVERLFNERKLLSLSKDIYTAIKNNDFTYYQLAEQFSEISQNINRTKDSEYCTIKDLSEKNLDELFKSSNFIRTGLSSLDDKIIGLFNGQLVIIAGRPKMGKSTFAIQLIKNIKQHILFFSMEMKRTEIYSKILSSECDVDSWKIELNKLNDFERIKVLNSHNEIKEKINITVFDTAFNISKLKATIKKFYKAKKPVAIFIDYLQLITGGNSESQVLRIASITRDLKLLAMELNIPIVLLSQLSRESEKQNRRPIMSDLRDSGSIEQDADIIIFVHEEDGQTEIIVGANRKGKSGIVKGIKFVKEFSRFEDSKISEVFENPKYFND
ncbi:MAG: DnaB-like helicase C-terminal domain-containing protein [Eubacteriales bacterium]|nr:DnaB-like helicase C-terminal domain-containing protein [Eubacteriales bacterium]